MQRITAASAPTPSPTLVGIEGGGTKTVAWIQCGTERRRVEAGPGNLRLLTDAQLTQLLQSLSSHVTNVDAVAIGLAGTRSEADRKRIVTAAAKVFGNVPCYATNDLETALAASDSNSFTRSKKAEARILIISGTGSCCYGRRSDGTIAKTGGWGHVLGDEGSGYQIALQALRAVAAQWDEKKKWGALGQTIVRHLQLNSPEQLIDWINGASKDQVAAVAIPVFTAWQRRDALAKTVVQHAAASLAMQATVCASRLARKTDRVEFVMAGSVPQKVPTFAALVRKQILRLRPNSTANVLVEDTALGALVLAERLISHQTSITRRNAVLSPVAAPQFPARSSQLSPTEGRHPASITLDTMPIERAVELMLKEDKTLPDVLLTKRTEIAQAIRWIAAAFKQGGRLFYAGAGTSGRLGILDASECPPTFRSDPEMVQGIIAGGQRAIWQAVEGAEDSPAAGAESIEFREVGPRDVVVGIAASGTTPFVWGALGEAKKRGAKTILLCFNPHIVVDRSAKPSLIIAPDLGPELLTGSTRLKAGTATKLVLNIFTTLAMVQIGKVVSNLMVDVHPSNAKLRLRAIRILRQLIDVDDAAAEQALENSGWIIKQALQQLSRARK